MGEVVGLRVTADDSAQRVIECLQGDGIKSVITISADGSKDYYVRVSDDLTKSEIIGLLFMAAVNAAMLDVERG